MGIIRQKKYMSGVQSNKNLDLGYKYENAIKYTLEILDNRKKLIGQNETLGFRSVAYFTTCIEPAKQAIRMDFMMKKVGLE